MEGALLGAAALRVHGFPPLLLDLEAVRDDDRVLEIFRQLGHWGAIAKSNYSGLRFREPTLRTYSRPVNLRRFDRLGWMTAEDDVWEIPEYLTGIAHTPLLHPDLRRGLNRVDARLQAAGKLGGVD
jgi:hypothetical protein